MMPCNISLKKVAKFCIFNKNTRSEPLTSVVCCSLKYIWEKLLSCKSSHLEATNFDV